MTKILVIEDEESVRCNESVVVKTQTLRAGSSRPFRVEGQEMAIATPLGIGFYPQDGADSDALIENAKTVAFMDGIDQNPKNTALSQAIIKMADSLQLKTVAKGGRTLAELTFLGQSTCHVMRNYFLSKSLKADDFQQLLVGKKQLPIPG